MLLTRTLLPSLVLGMLASGPASAAILVQYNFTGATGVSSDTNLETVASSYDPRTAANGDDGEGHDNSGLSGSGNAYMRPTLTPATSDPTTSNTYHEFSLSVVGLLPGQVLNLTSMSYIYVHPGASGTGFTDIYTDATGLSGTGDALGGSTATALTPTIDLTTANAAVDPGELNGLQNGDVITFRIYFGDGVDITSPVHRVDDIVVNGEIVAIPEPASIVLMGLGGLCAFRRRRA